MKPLKTEIEEILVSVMSDYTGDSEKSVGDATQDILTLIDSVVQEIAPGWIPNPEGEVSAYTMGRRDERLEVRARWEEVRG